MCCFGKCRKVVEKLAWDKSSKREREGPSIDSVWENEHRFEDDGNGDATKYASFISSGGIKVLVELQASISVAKPRKTCS